MISGTNTAVDPKNRAGGTGPTGEDGTAQLVRRRIFAVDGMRCGNCAGHVEQALLSVPGVLGAGVDLTAATADVSYDVTLVTLTALQESVGVAGYRLRELPAADALEQAVPIPHRGFAGWPVAAGAFAAILLSGLYIAIVGLAQGLDHAIELLVGDWYVVIPIVVGFGIQVGLFVYVRNGLRLRRETGSAKALGGAGTGTSTVSMVACCAHHLTDVMPILGLSGAALFLNEYRAPLMVLGIITNAIGIAVMVRLVRRSGRGIVADGPLRSDTAIGLSDACAGDISSTSLF